MYLKMIVTLPIEKKRSYLESVSKDTFAAAKDTFGALTILQ